LIRLNGKGPGSTPEAPLAFVAKLSDSESELQDSGGVVDTTSEDGATSRYLYYQLYSRNGEMHSKVAFVTGEPSIGRIRADSVAPPHTPLAILRCISRVEGKPPLAPAGLYEDRSCKNPMKETHILIMKGRCPGMTWAKPMAVVFR